MSLTQHQRLEAIAHAGFLAAYHRHIGYLYAGGLEPDWINASMAGMRQKFNAGEIWYPDCRASILWIARWSGWKSPTGLGWAGGSANMWSHLPHVEQEKAGTCDLVTYGPGGDQHVCMLVRPGWVFSLGSAYNAHIIPLQYETAAHQGEPVTFLDTSGL